MTLQVVTCILTMATCLILVASAIVVVSAVIEIHKILSDNTIKIVNKTKKHDYFFVTPMDLENK